MERLTRLMGIGLLVGLAAYSISQYQQTVAAITPVDEDPELVLPIEIERRQAAEAEAELDAGDAAAPPPPLLAFAEGYPSGRYTVEYAPIVDESDPEESSESSRSSAKRSFDDEQSPVVAPSDVLPGTLAPGLYATTFDVERCSYEIRRNVRRSDEDRIIGEDYLMAGRLLVSLNEVEPDVFIADPACGDWVPWSPLTEPLTEAGNGDYWVGDLANGTWTVPNKCVWEKVVGFRGAELVDVQASGIGPRQLVVDEETLGVRIRGCASPIEIDR